MKKIFVGIIIYVLALSPYLAIAETHYPDAATLVGNYDGQDSLNKPCQVHITRRGNLLNVSILSNGQRIEFRNADISEINRKVVSDTDFRRREDPDFSDTYISVNFYRGIQSHEMLGARWHMGKELTYIGIERQTGGGPFVSPNQRMGITCFGLD